jgi:two-component system, OmpR family, sensor kinase
VLDGGVAIDVVDAGKGFPPDVAGRAFERFARGDEARASSGSGLGLAIVRAVAEAHGGVASIVPGPGATVRLWLPAERELVEH